MNSMKKGGLYFAGALTAALAMSAAAPHATAADPMTEWKSDVAKLIGKKQVYPRAALSREIEGSAKVMIKIDRTGHVMSYDVLQATGHEELDEDIPKLVKRIDPLPEPPSAISDAELTMTLPLTWVIR
jgi:periplasmic protein TonB